MILQLDFETVPTMVFFVFLVMQLFYFKILNYYIHVCIIIVSVLLYLRQWTHYIFNSVYYIGMSGVWGIIILTHL